MTTRASLNSVNEWFVGLRMGREADCICEHGEGFPGGDRTVLK